MKAKPGGPAIGECRLHRPDHDGIARTDVKLLPDHGENRYGVEIKRGLLDYLFARTDCAAVDGTPNVSNTASIRMQEAVGGIRVGEDIAEFPEAMPAYTMLVPYYRY